MTRTLFCLLVVCCFLSKVYWSTSPVQNQCNAVSKVTEWLKKWIPIREIEGLSACRKYKTETIATPYKHETEMIRKTMAGSSDGKKANSFEERKFNTCTYMNENFTQICSNQMKQIIAAKLWPLSQEKYGHWDEAACDRIAANSLQAERSTDNYSISWSIKSSAAVEDQAIEVALKADDQSEAIENQSASLVCQIMLLKQAVPHQTTPSELPTKESIESSKALHSYKGFQRTLLMSGFGAEESITMSKFGWLSYYENWTVTMIY
uniref:SCP domain-containing protein n=1 Tax=Trichuris muris TaxID=70415 RepID=A0A5S6QFI8_TRIMR